MYTSVKIELNNVTKSAVKKDFFKYIGEKTLSKVQYVFLNGSTIEVSVALLSKEDIGKLNKEYRNHDSVTDILSFAEYESSEDIEKNYKDKSKDLFLGELILCYDDIREYAQKEGIDFNKELTKVVSHGFLHLLGFSHGKKMFEIQDLVANLE